MFSFRSWSLRAGVVMALLAGLFSGAVAQPHADAAGDAACAPIAVAHDESAHHVGGATAPSAIAGDHCFLCHSLRSLHTPFDRFEQYHDAPRAEPPHPAPANAASRVEWAAVHGRAPPA